jgi:hypothetical protein
MDSGTFPNQGANLSCCVTLQKTPYAKEADEFLQKDFELHAFIAFFASAARNPIDAKQQMFLLIPATFEHRPNEGGYRRQASFVQSPFLVLDFDNGDLSPEVFEDIFWKNAKRGKKHCFLICNTLLPVTGRPEQVQSDYVLSASGLLD